MTPKFRGLGERMKKLQHNLDHEAEKLDARITATEARGTDVFAKTHKSIDGAHVNLDEIAEVLDAIEGTNSGDRPTTRDSSNGSDASRSSEIATRRTP